MAVRQAQRAPVGPVAPFLHARHGGRGQMPEQVVGEQRRTHRQAQRQGPGRRPRGCRGRPGVAARVGDEREDLPHGVVECPDAGESGGESDVTHGQRCRLDQQPGRLRPLSARERERTRAELGEQLPFDLPGAVTEPGGKAGDARRGRPRRRRSAASPGRPRRRARSTAGIRGSRPAGTACRRGIRPAVPRPRSGRSACSGPWAAPPGSSAGSRSRW